jgi:hypothetical protein
VVSPFRVYVAIVQKRNRISVMIQDVIMREMGSKKGAGSARPNAEATPPRSPGTRPCFPVTNASPLTARRRRR